MHQLKNIMLMLDDREGYLLASIGEYDAELNQPAWGRHIFITKQEKAAEDGIGRG